MQLFTKKQPTMMSNKFFSMLLGGTLTMMVVSVMLMSDSIIAGSVIGSDAVAGVTLVTPLYSLGAFFGSVISLGVPILYTTEMGKFNKERADQVFGLGVLMSIIMGVVLFLLTCLFGEMYLLSSSPSEEILNQARGYLFWMRFTILIIPMQSLLAATVYSDGDETVSTIANAVQGLGNITFSIILSHFIGIRGIGLASCTFYVIAVLILMVHFKRKSNTLRWNLYFSPEVLGKVFRYSIIDSSCYLFFAILTAVLNAFIGAQFGPEYLILASVITLSREFQLLFDGIGQASAPIFSVYLGEENQSGLRSSYDLSNRTAIIEGILVTLVLLIIAPFVPMVLNITQPELMGMAVTGIRVTALGAAFISILYLISSYYLVINQILLGVVVCALRDVVLSASLAVILGKALGVPGMFAGFAIAPAMAYALLMIFVKMRYGKEEWPLLLTKVPGSDKSFLFQLKVDPNEIIGLQKNVEALLKENDVDKRTVGRIKLLIEELYMLIYEKNEGKQVLSECTIFLRPEGVQIITKDDGVLFDISEEDVSVTSLAAFAVSAYMEKLGEDRRHLTTMSFNRSAFLIKPLAE